MKSEHAERETGWFLQSASAPSIINAWRGKKASGSRGLTGQANSTAADSTGSVKRIDKKKKKAINLIIRDLHSQASRFRL